MTENFSYINKQNNIFFLSKITKILDEKKVGYKISEQNKSMPIGQLLPVLYMSTLDAYAIIGYDSSEESENFISACKKHNERLKKPVFLFYFNPTLESYHMISAFDNLLCRYTVPDFS